MTTTKRSSETAGTAAAARAAHLIVDKPPLIFEDTLAAALLGAEAETLIDYHRLHGDHLVLSHARTGVACRARYTEDRLAEGVRRGVRQYIILGAGLDTFAYRSELANQVRVFEVDHPATQESKRRRLAEAGVAEPENVAYIAADLAVDPLIERLVSGGFDLARPAVVSWLGVTMYLDASAVAATLAALGGLATGTEIIVEYMVPAELRDADGQTYVDLVTPFAAERGEPWLGFFSPDEMSTLLTGHGFGSVEHVTQRDMIAPALWDREDGLRPSTLGRISTARL
jgi:methyltransferase (TIGR00027 family)